MKTILVFAALLAVAAPAAAAPLDEVAASLKATTSLAAGFSQTAPDGSVRTGQMILARPGKIRFSYDKAKLLIVGNGKTLTFVDYAVNQVSQWPVKSTPLGILLSSEPDLSGVAKIVAADARGVLVEARDPKRPEFGTLQIAFARDSAAPGGLALKGWTARDAQGGTSEVRLSDARYNADLSKADFGFRDPRRNAVPR
jgi:outer membrane lipoprotein-sorting protein